MRERRRNERAIYLDDRNRARVVRLDEPIVIASPRRAGASIMIGQVAVLSPAALASGVAWGVPGAALVAAVGGAVMLLQYLVWGAR